MRTLEKQSTQSTENTVRASVLAYTDLLKKHDNPQHPRVVEYRQQFGDDATFQKRVVVINALYLQAKQPAL